MRNIRRFLIPTAIPILFGLVILLLSLNNCQRFEPEGFLYFTTDTIQSLGGGSYTLKGTIEDTGEDVILDHGFCWSEQREPSTNGSFSAEGQINFPGSISSTIYGLSPNTTYYYRAYVITTGGTTYANEKWFLTESISPTITTSSITEFAETTAEGGGNVTSDGGSLITARGVCWSTAQNPTTSNPKTTETGSTGIFTSSLTGLICGTTYYVRAYATNERGTTYGNQVQFTTSSCSGADPPTVNTSVISSFTETTAEGGGNVTGDGGASITARGVCWSTAQNPTTSNPRTTESGATGSFTSSLTGLVCGTTYYVRAYATNSAGTTYGLQEQFTTLACPVPPSVTTNAVTGVTQTAAQGGGNVTSDGGATITAIGICWSTRQNPDLSDSKTTETGTTGSFASTIDGLTCGTSYYVRAYATNLAGTSYGPQEQFTTAQCPVPPTVTTSAVNGITASSVQCGGNVGNDGGAPVTARGVCWNTTGNPDISDLTTTNGIGIGTFYSPVTGLDPLTTYYMRAYAVNSAGTSYGSVKTFKTLWDNRTISDVDGNNYATIQIGEQVWMAENLKATHYDDGGVIQLVSDDAEWENLDLSEGAYCWYENDPVYKNTFGALYNFAAATNGGGGSDEVPSGIQGVCPAGWHLPSDAEWKEMEIVLGMDQGDADGMVWRGTTEGGKLKAVGTTYWIDPNIGANNVSGFSGLPGGYRNEFSFYFFLGSYAVFWTSSEYSSTEAIHRNLLNDYEQIYRYYYNKRGGFSVRCVRD